MIVKDIKNGKSPGESSIQMKTIKYGKGLQGKIYNLIVLVWEQEKILKEWKKSIIVPIHKKGNKRGCANYIWIVLLGTCCKLLSHYIRKN